MEELTEGRIKEIYNFLNENKQLIWNMAVSDFYGRVWLNNIINGELELSAGDHPINTEDSIVIYQLKSKWYLDIPDEILGWKRKDGKVYKYCSDGYRLLSDEEQLDDIYNCGFFYFCEDFIINDIIKEIKKKFKKEVNNE